MKLLLAALAGASLASSAFAQVPEVCVENCDAGTVAPSPAPSGPSPAELERRRKEQEEKERAAAENGMMQDANDRGLSLYKKGRYKEAIAAFREALAHSPGDPVISKNLAKARRKAAETEAAPRRETAAPEGTTVEPESVPAAPAARIGAAAAVKGGVFIENADGVQVPLKSGDPVPLGAHVLTGPGAHLQILLMDETVFTLGPLSDMVLDEFVYDPNATAGKVTANLLKGTFRYVSGKMRKAADNIKIFLPQGAIGIRGTDVAIRIADDQSGEIELRSGLLDVTSSATGATLSLHAGQRVSFAADGTFGAPQPLRAGEK